MRVRAQVGFEWIIDSVHIFVLQTHRDDARNSKPAVFFGFRLTTEIHFHQDHHIRYDSLFEESRYLILFESYGRASLTLGQQEV